jgi:hypothetical protein
MGHISPNLRSPRSPFLSSRIRPTTSRGNRATLHRARPPAGEELTGLLDILSQRMVGLLERRGLLIADPDHPHLNLEPGSSLDQIQAASITRDGCAFLLRPCGSCVRRLGPARATASLPYCLRCAQDVRSLSPALSHRHWATRRAQGTR